MRPFKPAPKNAAANRIRERYLHQLGLQRGGASLTAPHLSQADNHVVVISGLPTLPEDRATTTEHVMESHDFSISKHSQHTGVSPGSVDAFSFGENDDMESDLGSVTHSCGGSVRESIPCSGDGHSHCSKSTLSVSPSNARESNKTLTSMALSYPKALLKIPPPAKLTPPPSGNNTLPFSLSHSVPWRASLSKPASVLLDLSEYHHGNDHDSVSSAGTSTTAESSLTAAMVSRDWGATPHTIISAGVSISSQGGESPSSTPGVYFQCGHSRLLGGNNATVGGNCATSSLSHALNRFNIDSDCEVSVASNSIVEDHTMDEDDASFDDTASRTSVTSLTSAGSCCSKSQISAPHNIRARKKIGKKRRLMERAVAHERILQIRNDQSLKMRASVVHSQRMGNNHSISGLSTAVAQDTQLSASPCSIPSSIGQASVPLLHHVQHKAAAHEELRLQSMSDLGRTPTASNCSDLRRLNVLKPPSQYLSTLPIGVHVSDNTQETVQYLHGSDYGSARKTAPLRSHPQLASCMPAPPKLAYGMMVPAGTSPANNSIIGSLTESFSAEARETEKSTSLQHMNHQATVDDIMEVAMTLSKLGGGRTGPVPRIR